jgi:hypothetical protein
MAGYMVSSALPLPAALIVGHPGHELRLFRWLETARPVVFVLTDGSGGSGQSRTASTRALLGPTGSTAGPVLGAITDIEIYDAMMRGDIDRVAAMTEAIAESLVQYGVRAVVADAFEFYNPTHDLCAVVATLAAARAGAMASTRIERYDYPVTTGASGEGIVLRLDPADVERKLAAAYEFENLTNDVDQLLRDVGPEDVSRELLRPVSTTLELPAPARKPYYESRGEERVASGRYRTVLRYEQHFVPFVRALAGAVGVAELMAAPAYSAKS